MPTNRAIIIAFALYKGIFPSQIVREFVQFTLVEPAHGRSDCGIIIPPPPLPPRENLGMGPKFPDNKND